MSTFLHDADNDDNTDDNRTMTIPQCFLIKQLIKNEDTIEELLSQKHICSL